MVSTPGSGLVLDNSYDGSDTTQFIAYIVAAESNLKSLFDNTITISVQFFEQNQGKNGIALSNSADSYRGVSSRT